MLTDMTEVLSRSRASLSPAVRDILTAGRTVRSRNRDGEYAIILTDNRAVVDGAAGERMDGIADQRADWTIAITDFTFDNVVAAPPELRFFAPVFARNGDRVGTIAVNGSAKGRRRTDRGVVDTEVMPFASLHAGDLFAEQATDDQNRCITFRVVTDPDIDGQSVVEEVLSHEQRTFEPGPDYLVFRLL
jgi:hypothetical protein